MLDEDPNLDEIVEERNGSLGDESIPPELLPLVLGRLIVASIDVEHRVVVDDADGEDDAAFACGGPKIGLNRGLLRR